MRKKLIVLLVILIACSSVLSSVAFAAKDFPEELAVLKDDLAGSIPDSALADCRAALAPVYDLETLEFLKFLEINFQNKSSNSSLVNIAIARYAEYKRRLNEHLARLKVTSSDEDLQRIQSDALDSYQFCIKMTDAYLTLAKQRLIEHVRNNTVQKKTTMLVEKYKAISERLRDMNLALAEMHGYYTAFRNLLPGFLKKCLKQ